MKVAVGIALLAVVCVVGGVASTILFNPFDFGECDGNGPADGARLEYYDNGNVRVEGTVKDCRWDGVVTHSYASGGIESRCTYAAGFKNGPAVYFSPNGAEYKHENYLAGALLDFVVQDTVGRATFSFRGDTLMRASADGELAVAFGRPHTMRGNDEPFVSLYKDKLVLRGAQDFYIINAELGIELNLRDTLLKYIPSAYEEKVDVSGNRHTFLWHRTITDDLLSVRVFYDMDEHQSGGKIWDVQYVL